ncbi:MAG: RES family NAD+ phosphorylase [Acidobacteria bacterium]|jgi:RES domain-containing protein|nr:RES family NAD+ phosphorylase [Acidobacteriota bacterium]MBA3785013.1 RES family NAD+ phosphorylase [Acidobacteriota bacterium]MBA4184492.1 RES family NAD+ phosphorylase [Acidobacteriota bacterium]HEV8158863.1 RES family NAD+ phosphorylase [Pyrinomonadaceae bacterium]
MEAFRLSREKYAAPLSGKGAAMKGARWNSVGVELIYTASNRSLAMAEVAVHLTMATIPSDYVMLTIYLPDDISTQKLTETDLPTNWNAFPHPISTQVIGDKFIADNNYCVLQIPSVVTQGDYNLLINPYHSDFSKIKIIAIEKFPFDKRIFK